MSGSVSTCVPSPASAGAVGGLITATCIALSRPPISTTTLGPLSGSLRRPHFSGYRRSKYVIADAQKSAQAAIDVKDDCYLARLVVANILRDRGETDKAVEEYRWFLRAFNEWAGGG